MPGNVPDDDILLEAGLLRADGSALRREWLVTNGLGGYASATLAGANTRRYHGLLVAALRPPLGRAVLLSKLEEKVYLKLPDGITQEFALSANLFPGAYVPQGNRMLDSWRPRPAATWIWSPVPGVKLQKQVWMARGFNTTYIAYRLLECPSGTSVRLSLVPLLAWKDYHSEMRQCDTELNPQWSDSALKLTLPPIARVTGEPTTLHVRLVDGAGCPAANAAFRAAPDWYCNFQHPREQERGQDSVEDLFAPGILSVDLPADGMVAVVAGVDPVCPDPPDGSLRAMISRQNDLLLRAKSSDAFTHQLALAGDAFLAQPHGGRSTVIAGYHWFGDWGRDTMISLPGLCLATGRHEAARDILRSFAAYVDGGMLPNRFPDEGETPEYNTVDATLWYFVALYHYLEATHDLDLLSDTLWPVLREIARCHLQGTRYNIHVDPSDHLLYAGQEGVQLTWMDAKVGDWVVTPRIGKPVEINALWHNALCVLAWCGEQMGNAEVAAEYRKEACANAKSFQERFARPDGRGLYDVLDTPHGNMPDLAIRPNQIFALSLPFAPLSIDSPLAKPLLETVRTELYTPCGLRTLAPGDPAYHPRYEGDVCQRDEAYHQGTVWPWLLGPYAEAHYKVSGDRDAALALLRPMQRQWTGFGVGFLAEVFDGNPPHRPNGCIAQAWSVAETLRVWKLLNGGQ